MIERRLPITPIAPGPTSDRTHIDAPCSTAPDLWFATDPDGIAYAKSVCARCPLRDACLNAALDLEEPHGIWGGKTPDERKHGRLKCRAGCDRTFESLRARASHESKGHAAKPTHCGRGHEMTGYNILVSRGKRECRTCSVARGRAYRARVRQAAS